MRTSLCIALLLVACDGGAGPLDATAPGADASVSADAAQDAGAIDAGSTTPEHRALFVGNSYTFYNDLPSLYRTLLEGLPSPPAPLFVDSSTAGGRRLVEHLGDARDMEHPLFAALSADVTWTHVVLQEQSQIPGFGPGQPELEQSVTAAAELADLARMRGATVVLFVTWGRREGDDTNPGLFPDFATMQDRLDAGYARLAEEARATGATVLIAPVGPAFRVVHDGEADPLAADSRFWSLYAGDGSHPSPAGSYLAACVFVSTLLGVDATTLTHVPGALDPAEAEALRAAAQVAVDAL